tara:strand:- start:920 stop:1054 length:135 start_codon:yes stop_codon:yes gene_type:complete
MYPYKEEIVSSAKAFVLAWAIILVPVMTVANVVYLATPQVLTNE